jgi:hypothetical protein
MVLHAFGQQFARYEAYDQGKADTQAVENLIGRHHWYPG